METVTLSKIVKTLAPHWHPVLTSKELDSKIVLRQGLASLNTEDVLEIIEASIKLNHGHDALIH